MYRFYSKSVEYIADEKNVKISQICFASIGRLLAVFSNWTKGFITIKYDIDVTFDSSFHAAGSDFWNFIAVE